MGIYCLHLPTSANIQQRAYHIDIIRSTESTGIKPREPLVSRWNPALDSDVLWKGGDVTLKLFPSLGYVWKWGIPPIIAI